MKRIAEEIPTYLTDWEVAGLTECHMECRQNAREREKKGRTIYHTRGKPM